MLLEGYTSFSRNNFSKTIRRTMAFRRTAYVSAGLLLLLLLLTLCPVYLVPEATEAATKDPNPSTPGNLALTITKPNASVSFNLTYDPTKENGSFATSSNNEKASFSVATNNATGYTLNLKTSSNTTSLSDGTNTIASITNTNGITATSFSANTWGLLPSKYNGTANTTNYYPASTSGFKMDETSAANTTANTYTVGLGIKADYNTPAGTYTNTAVVAEYVANAITYAVHYYTNTNDTVTGMPGINPQTGTVAQGTTSTSVTLASAPSRTGYTFIGWCLGSNASTSNITVKTDGTPDICANSSTNQFTAGQSFGIDATKSPDTYYLFAMWQRISFTITRQYKLQDTAGNYPSTYTADTNATVLYGDSYTYTIAATTSHQAASTTITNVTSAQTISLDVPRVHVTCNTQFRYEDQDGNWGSYTSDTSTWAYYGGSCSYSKSGQYYRGSTSAANDTIGSANASSVTSTTTLSVSLYRNVYNLAVTAGTNTSGASGGGSKRWGQVVQVSVTKAANVTCTTYATPSWSQGSASGTIGNTSNNGNTYYMNYTMPRSDAEVTATSSASSVSQVITFKTSNATTITFNGANKSHNDTATVNCGTYNLVAAAFPTGYEFSSWSNTAGTIASTSSSSTTFTVNGPATITLNGKKKTFSLKINFAGTGVSSVQVRTASGTGGTLKGTVSSSGGSVSGLEYNTAYYLYPSFSSGHEFSAWAKNSSAGTLSSTSSSNPTFTMGNGAGEVTITGKASCSSTISGNMQSAGSASSYCDGATGTMTDSRDNQTYTVAKIAGALWMTRNLAIGCNGSGSTYGSSVSSKSLTSSNSNVSATWSTPTALLSTRENSLSPDGYTTAAMMCSSTYGAWYNYAAATAGTITGDSNETEDTYNICPKGWTLPGYDANSSSGSINSITSQATAFSPVAGGYYFGGSLSGTGVAYWWPTTAYESDAAYRRTLYYNGSNLYTVNVLQRFVGVYVRCVRTS